MNWMIRLGTPAALVAGLTFVSATGAAAGTLSGPSSECPAVAGTGTGGATGPLSTAATVTDIIGGALLDGTTEGSFNPPTPTSNPSVVAISGAVTFLPSAGGSLTDSFAGALNLSNGDFYGTGPLTGGTGLFSGARGVAGFAGVQNLTTGAFQEGYAVQVCLAG
jgi:hypothetical protein